MENKLYDYWLEATQSSLPTEKRRLALMNLLKCPTPQEEVRLMLLIASFLERSLRDEATKRPLRAVIAMEYCLAIIPVLFAQYRVDKPPKAFFDKMADLLEHVEMEK